MIENAPLTIPVDAEHGALRFVLVGVFIAGAVITYLILDALIVAQDLTFLMAVASIIIGALVTQPIDRYLKRRWPSGRFVQIDPAGVRIVSKDKVEREMDPSLPCNVVFWRFPIKRRTRVPKGWFMMACALEQENVYLTVYTFMSPQQAEQFRFIERFTPLRSKKETQQAGGRDNLRLAGEQRRLHLAEDQRWMDGAEMSTADFETYLTRLQTQFPQWLPSAS